MYPIPPSENLVELRTCRQCSADFPITDKDVEFYSRVSPSFPIASFWKEVPTEEAEDFQRWYTENPPSSQAQTAPFKRSLQFPIPPPTLCPDCRQQRRLSFRNERKLYKRKCDATWKDIISIYSPDKPYTVYHQDYWWSDSWNPMKYGREFDFARSAFEQFWELMKEVPRLGLFVEKTVENGEYSNDTWHSKDIYFTFNGWSGECLYYCDAFFNTKNCVDCDWIIQWENSYFSYKCTSITHSFYLFFSSNCNDSSYLDDCQGCSFCTLCVWMMNKKHCFQNQQYSEEKYTVLIREFSQKLFNEKFDIFAQNIKKKPIRWIKNNSCENVIWDGLLNCKDVKYVFDSFNSRNSAYWVNIIGEDMYDVYNCGSPWAQIVESLASYRIDKCGYVFNSTDISTSYYSDSIHRTTHCFLCIWLRNASYCILNKQYTKEEYETLVPKIIQHMLKTGEWGEFFPASMSPFGYNETVAQEYYPMSREEVLWETSFWKEVPRYEAEDFQKQEISPSRYDTAGHPSFKRGLYFNWSDYEAPFPQVEKIIPASKLPDTIEWIPNDILTWAIECEVSGKPFRIIRQELEFYRKHSIPIPRRHPDVRHMDRMKMRNPRKLFERICDCESCEVNWKEKGVILREGMDAGYFLLEEKIQGDSGTEKKNPPSITTETGDWHLLSKGGLRKKMITTYAPERPEKVYCEVCYEREVIS